jgi:hypothetical protein
MPANVPGCSRSNASQAARSVVGHRVIGGIHGTVLARHPGLKLEADEIERILGEKVRNLRNRQAVFLHVEQ